MYYIGFGYADAMKLPIWQRKWFIERLVEELKNSNGQSKAAHSNTPDARAAQGMNHAHAPAKLRRFT